MTSPPNNRYVQRAQFTEEQLQVFLGALEAKFAVIGGVPGAGRTSLALELVVESINRGADPDRVILLTPSRLGATRLRQVLAQRAGRTTGGALARTPAALAHGILRARAVLEGEPPPVLVSGPEQDTLIADLLGGHLAGFGVQVDWSVPKEVLPLAAFRHELREFYARLAERGVSSEDLAELAGEAQQPHWKMVAALYREYLDVLQFSTLTADRGQRFDSAAVLAGAVATLHSWPQDMPGSRPHWDVVVADDFQEANEAYWQLLNQLREAGTQVIVLGQPDTAVETYRGALPRIFAQAGRDAGDNYFDLSKNLRQSTELAEVTAQVSAQIATRHQPVPERPQITSSAQKSVVQAAILDSRATQTRYIAAELRRRHLLEGRDWSQMAVIVRASQDVVSLSQDLARQEIPVQAAGIQLALRDEPLVKPFLAVVELALSLGAEEEVPASDYQHLLLSPLGEFDSLRLRRLRRVLRHHLGEPELSSDELLAQVIADPAPVGELPRELRTGVRRVATVFRAATEVVNSTGLTVEQMLWELWAASGLASSLQQVALSETPAAPRANQDLDAMMRLFAAAQRFDERMPGAGLKQFMNHIRGQAIAEDSLAGQRTARSGVTVATVAGSRGDQWEVVVLAGLQEGSWPDLRIRDSLLGAQTFADFQDARLELRDLVEQKPAAISARFTAQRRQILDDELRLLTTAVSRARAEVLCTAIRDEEVAPSLFIDLLSPPSTEVRPTIHTIEDLNLSSLVSQLRRYVVASAAGTGEGHGIGRRWQLSPDQAAATLAYLIEQEVPGADPQHWHGLRPLSTVDPLQPDGAKLTVSPSKIEQIANCALRWALASSGGDTPSQYAQSLGNLVHQLAQDFPDGDPGELQQALEQRFGTLGLPKGWIADRAYRDAQEVVRRLAIYLQSHAGTELVATEFPVDADLGSVRVLGSVDRLEKIGSEEHRLVDFKTGKAITAADAAQNPQLGVYQAALETAGFPVTSAELVYLAQGAKGPAIRKQLSLDTPLPAPNTAEDDTPQPEPPLLREHVKSLLETAAAEATSPQLTVTVGEHCRSCPVRTSCPLQTEGRPAL